MDPRLLRIVYMAEFLLALIAVYTVWSQVGGQGHLDQMAWYLKLPLGGLMAYAIVRATISAVGDEHVWNGRVLRWTGMVVLLAILQGLVTYYAHVNESDEDDTDEPTTTSMLMWRRELASAPCATPRLSPMLFVDIAQRQHGSGAG